MLYGIGFGWIQHARTRELLDGADGGLWAMGKGGSTIADGEYEVWMSIKRVSYTHILLAAQLNINDSNIFQWLCFIYACCFGTSGFVPRNNNENYNNNNNCVSENVFANENLASAEY